MGVLETRKDAEKVGFPVVGEEKKDASNIIDYDIHEEITIDASSVLNANNQTTTGIATVIPGVNAPKLKMSTSIVFDEEIIIPTVNEKLTATGSTIYRPGESSTMINNMTVSENYGTETIAYHVTGQGYYYNGMQIPVDGYYQFEVTYPGSSTTYGWIFQWRTPRGGGSADTIWRSYTTAWNSSDEYETFVRYFNKGDLFCIFAIMNRNSSTSISDAPVVTMKVTKL